MMDYDCRSSEKRLAAVENDWLAAPRRMQSCWRYIPAVYAAILFLKVTSIWLWTAAAKYAANVWKG